MHYLLQGCSDFTRYLSAFWKTLWSKSMNREHVRKGPVRIWRGLRDANEAVHHITTWHRTANIAVTEECIFLTQNMLLQFYYLSFMIEDPIISSLLNILRQSEITLRTKLTECTTDVWAGIIEHSGILQIFFHCWCEPGHLFQIAEIVYQCHK